MSRLLRLTTGFLFVTSLFTSPALADDAPKPAGNADVVKSMPGLVGFWTFGEEPGKPRESVGTKQKHPLEEVGGFINRAPGGPFSGYSVDFDGKHYFRIPHKDLGDLDIGGKDAKVSMFAVIRLDELKRGVTVAGIWSEGKGANDDTGTRQYAMLINMPTYGGPKQLTPHISSEGGVSRRKDGSGLPWCADYAASKSEVPVGRWVTLGFTYDGQYIRAYFNGVMEQREVNPKADKRDDRYFTTEGPDGKHRGINPYYHGRGIFKYDPVLHAKTKPGGGADFTVAARYAVGSMLGEAMKGRLGGLAVFDRAISDEEMKKLHDAAGIDHLPAAGLGGDFGNAKRIVFVYDCTGTMLNKMAALKQSLDETLRGLGPDVSFNMIFFYDGPKAMIFNSTDLVPATPENLKKAVAFLENEVTPSGPTDPSVALESAFKFKPELIQFLAEGEFNNLKTYGEISADIARWNRDVRARINTVQYETVDREAIDVLRKIAAQYGGTYKYFMAARED